MLVYRTNSLKQIRYALVILITGIAIYMVRAWRNREWPFRRPAPKVLPLPEASGD